MKVFTEDIIWPMPGEEAKMTHYRVFPEIDLYINDIRGNSMISGYPEPVDTVKGTGIDDGIDRWNRGTFTGIHSIRSCPACQTS